MKLIRVNSKNRIKRRLFSEFLPVFYKEKNSSPSSERALKNNCPTPKNIFLITIFTSFIIICVCILLWIILQKSYEDSFHNQNFGRMIYRSEWGGQEPLFERPLNHPVKYVLVSHTASQTCLTINDCSKLVRQFQAQHFAEYGSPDVGYNFLIGGDENIYVGRGWDAINFHMNDSIGISFIGNFVFDKLSAGMIKAAQKLLKEGVEEGKLDKNYKLISHNQTWNTLSPGVNVYESIRFWPHYSAELVPIVYP